MEKFAGSERGYQDGDSKEAKFNMPEGITVNEYTGKVYVSDTHNHVIREISEGTYLKLKHEINIFDL